MLKTMKFNRKSFDVDGVQVTVDNFNDVAKWVGGDIRTDADEAKYIKVRVHRPANDRQTKAYVGDWVLYAGKGFKVYSDKAFKNSFDLVSDETTTQEGSPVEGQIDAVVVVTEQPKEKKSA